MLLHNLDSLLNDLEGYWISHQTIYSIHNKKIRSQETKVQIHNIQRYEKELLSNKQISKRYTYNAFNNCPLIYDYLITDDIVQLKGRIQKYSSNRVEEYPFIFANKCLKISYSRNKFNYAEYNYFISSTFRISIIIIKINNKYVTIAFNSNIKIK